MQIENFTLSSHDGEYIRQATFAMPETGNARTLAIFLDGDLYLRKMDAVQVIAALIKSESIPPLACLFIFSDSAEQRHHDYPCNPDFARFVACDARDWALDKCPTLETSGHLVSGLSLSGLAAAFIRLTYPARFDRALCQSGSFWWRNQWLAKHLPPTDPGRYWISVGDKETQSDLTHAPTGMRQKTSQLESVERFASALEAADNTVHHHVSEGGHEARRWAAELPEALQWLFAARP